MIFHENCLLADNSHEIPYLIFSEIRKDVAKIVVCCGHDWRFKGLIGWFHNSSGMMLDKKRQNNLDSLHPSQQSFSYVGTCLPGLKQYYARIPILLNRVEKL